MALQAALAAPFIIKGSASRLRRDSLTLKCLAYESLRLVQNSGINKLPFSKRIQKPLCQSALTVVLIKPPQVSALGPGISQTYFCLIRNFSRKDFWQAPIFANCYGLMVESFLTKHSLALSYYWYFQAVPVLK